MFKHNWEKLPKWVSKAYEEGVINTITEDGFIVKTLEGDMKATKNDYLIQGVMEDIYPCKIDIFNITYELVKEE